MERATPRLLRNALGFFGKPDGKNGLDGAAEGKDAMVGMSPTDDLQSDRQT